MDMSNIERLAERLVVAFEQIASSLDGLYSLEQERLKHEYPPKHEPTEATVTRIPNEEDKIREEQGGETDETLEEWTRLKPASSEPEPGSETERRSQV